MEVPEQGCRSLPQALSEHIDSESSKKMAEPATPVKLFGKWSLDDVELSDLALVVRALVQIFFKVKEFASLKLFVGRRTLSP